MSPDSDPGPDPDDGAESDDATDGGADPTGSDPTVSDASTPGTATTVGRVLLPLAAGLAALAVGVALFVVVSATLADVVGVLLALAVALGGAQLGGRVAGSLFPDYNVAEVTVEGPITRDGGRPTPLGRVAGATADEVVDRIEAADEDEAVDALLVTLNTPGGQIVPSDDIRNAVVAFDGPTVAHATDVCASGGYWIASGCDEVWAREASLVGSIGVVGSRPNVSELADRLGVSYEQFTAGEYKDAGNPLKEPTDADRDYLQGLIDEFYDDFVERVADGRDVAPEAVRETEARLYLGREAVDRGLVDAVGTRDAVEERVERLLGVPVSVADFDPERGLAARLRGGAERVAYALGAGITGALADDSAAEFRVRR